MAKHTDFLKTIRDKDAAWLRKELDTRYEKIRSLRFDVGFGTVSALKELRTAKRELAQLWTVLGEKLTRDAEGAKEKAN
ncbi:MAG: 50S ribosomal protein L29 [Patescibacteria group bacterium]|jgi:ribosomal protein L29